MATCCPRCSYEYDTCSRIPLVVPCGHSLCASCLTDPEEHVTCATCSEIFPAAVFPVNYSLKEQVIKLQPVSGDKFGSRLNWRCSLCSLRMHPRQARVCIRCLPIEAASMSATGITISDYKKTEAELICAHCAIESKHNLHITKLYLPHKIRQMTGEKSEVILDLIGQGFSCNEVSSIKEVLKAVQETSRELQTWSEFQKIWDEMESAVRTVGQANGQIKGHLAAIGRLAEQIRQEEELMKQAIETKKAVLCQMAYIMADESISPNPRRHRYKSESDSDTESSAGSLRRFDAMEDLTCSE